VAVGLAATVSMAVPAFAVNAGSATWSVSGSNLPSTTTLNLSLPSGAACTDPGGTGAYFESFLIPNTADPSALTNAINGQGFPDQGEPLVTAGGFLPSFAPATTPAGQVNPLYADGVQFSQYLSNNVALTGAEMSPASNTNGDPALFPTGSPNGTTESFLAGVACFSPTNAETDYWDVPVTLTLASSDSNGFTVTTATQGPVTPESPLAVGLPLTGGALLLGAGFVAYRRRRSTLAEV
jgi:hypothetical protein